MESGLDADTLRSLPAVMGRGSYGSLHTEEGMAEVGRVALLLPLRSKL